MPQYAFSLNGENWSGSFATRAEALSAAIQKCSGAADPPGTVFVGELLGGEAFTDHLGKPMIKELCARSQGSDISDCALRDLTIPQMNDLDALLENAVRGWLQKHRLTPQDSRVESISEHLTPVPHRGLTRSIHNGNGNGKREVQDLGVGEFPA